MFRQCCALVCVLVFVLHLICFLPKKLKESTWNRDNAISSYFLRAPDSGGVPFARFVLLISISFHRLTSLFSLTVLVWTSFRLSCPPSTTVLSCTESQLTSLSKDSHNLYLTVTLITMLMKQDVVEVVWSPGVCIQCNKESVLCVVCTRQYRCLSSVDNPSISLGDQSRVSRGCVERKRGSPLFRVRRQSLIWNDLNESKFLQTYV